MGSARLQLCLSDPYDTAPAAVRAPFGVKLINAKIVLNSGIITNPASTSYNQPTIQLNRLLRPYEAYTLERPRPVQT